MLYISNYNFEEMPEYIRYVWKYSFQNLTQKEEENLYNKFIQIKKGVLTKNEEKLKISFPIKKKEFIIDNINDYCLAPLLDQIAWTGSFNENEYIKYVRINKINNNLYMNKYLLIL